jgi:spermidine synthase
MISDFRERLVFEQSWQNTVVQVWEKGDRREMRFGNRIVQSARSLLQPDCLLLRYTRHTLLSLAFVPKPQRILHIGLGGGALPCFLREHFPNLRQTVLEINPVVVDAAQRFFQVPNDERLELRLGDLVQQRELVEGEFDLILLDAYENSGTASVFDSAELLMFLQDHLQPHGWLVGNFWSLFRLYPQQRQLWASLCEQLFESRTDTGGNAILFGHRRNATVSAHRLHLTARQLEETLPVRLRPMMRSLKEVPCDLASAGH